MALTIYSYKLVLLYLGIISGMYVICCGLIAEQKEINVL